MPHHISQSYNPPIMSSRVTLNSKLTVVSSKPIGPGKVHPLSPLDRAMGCHTLHIIFYYQRNLFGSFELDPLRESLSEVLTLYPKITGRLARGNDGNWQVRLNDAGVRVIKAKVDTTLHEWLTLTGGSQERDLTAWDDMPDNPDTWSPFRIQINEFEGGGVAIGLSCSHMLADVTCVTSFFKSWTEAHRRLPISDPPLFHSTALEARPVPKSAAYYATKTFNIAQRPSPTTRMATTTYFKFSNSIMKKCLAEIHGICPTATPFDFLSALFWTRIARLNPPNSNDQLSTLSLSICIDFRRLLKEPLPSGYFGNALHFSLLSLKARDMNESRLGDVASLVHNHLAEIGEEEIWSAIEWLKSQDHQDLEGGKFRPPTCMYGPELTCVCMEHMIVSSDHNLNDKEKSSMYAAMFSDNDKPVHVSCRLGNVEGERLIMVMPSPEGGLARTVMVMLPEEELGELCQDEAILELQPKLMLPGTPLMSH